MPQSERTSFEIADRALECLDLALQSNGVLLPVTESGIGASMPTDLNDELPASLRDPMQVLRRGTELEKTGLSLIGLGRHGTPIADAFALAARNGAALTPGLLERMHADRREAEQGRVKK